MRTFPCWVYHRTKPEFICPSQEFLDTLKDAKEYEFEPFTGPRKYIKPDCLKCEALKAERTELKKQVEKLSDTIMEQKMELNRLKIALEMKKNERNRKVIDTIIEV